MVEAVTGYGPIRVGTGKIDANMGTGTAKKVVNVVVADRVVVVVRQQCGGCAGSVNTIDRVGCAVSDVAELDGIVVVTVGARRRTENYNT